MLISIFDIFRYNGIDVVPSKTISLYRYVEQLVEVAVAKKYNLKNLLEIGPGIYPAEAHFNKILFNSVTVIDYNMKVLQFCQNSTKYINHEAIIANIEEPDALSKLHRNWDFIVSNGVLEHIKNDKSHINDIYLALEDSGILVAVTVLHRSLYNDWDKAVGHYKRYSIEEITQLFSQFNEVQIIQTGLLQELVRPLFFKRIRHLLNNSLEKNNMLFGSEVGNFSEPPYTKIFFLIKYLMPVYLLLDWLKSSLFGGIVIVVARK